MSEVGSQVGVVRVVELGGHLRNGDRRILPEPLCRFLEPVASDHCEWGQADVLLTEALQTSDGSRRLAS